MRARVARLQRCYTDTARPLRCKRPAVQHAAALHPCATRALHGLSITEADTTLRELLRCSAAGLPTFRRARAVTKQRAPMLLAPISNTGTALLGCAAPWAVACFSSAAARLTARPLPILKALMHARSARQLSGACGSGGATRLHVHANHCRSSYHHYPSSAADLALKISSYLFQALQRSSGKQGQANSGCVYPLFQAYT